VYPNTPVRDGEWSDEQAMRFVEQWQDVARRADAIATQLAPEQRPGYFELVQYPADAAAAFVEKMICAEQSRRRGARGDVSADAFADRAEAAARRVDELTRQYNEQLGGKWRYMMSDHPRDLPVFGPPLVARIEAQTKRPTTSPVATATMPSQTASVVRIGATRFARTTGHDARWTVVEGVGSDGAAIALFPRLWPHALRGPPTQPINAEHASVCGVSFDDDARRQLVHFDESKDEHDKTWQQNVLRNNMAGRVTIRLGAGAHTLHLCGLDPSVAVQAITIAPAAAAADQPGPATERP
jgi:hypothetical protein